MPADDPVEEETPVFTEADVYMLVGYLKETWGVDEDVDEVADTEDAIKAVLSLG